jgi:hypothetical protein
MKVSLKVLGQKSKETIGGFSSTSKMPWLSWSISADLCITGGKLAKIKGTICALCYAQKGTYNWPNTISAMQRRIDAWNDNLNWVDDFIASLGELANRLDDPSLLYFRWFDSGDIQSISMLNDIVAIAIGLPNVKFWLPTKEHGFVREYILNGGIIPDNLTIRLSAYKVNQMIEHNSVISKMLPNSIAVESDYSYFDWVYYCPSQKQGNKCLDCRSCWDKDTKTIAYTIH